MDHPRLYIIIDTQAYSGKLYLGLTKYFQTIRPITSWFLHVC